jgi:hypothetical protein
MFLIRILGERVHAVRALEALLVASKEIGLELNAKKTKYVVLSQDQHAGHNHNIKIDNKYFENVEHFKYLGTAPTIQTSIHDEIKNSGIAFYISVQSLLSFIFLSKI